MLHSSYSESLGKGEIGTEDLPYFDLLVLVPSNVKHLEKRDAIRQSWATRMNMLTFGCYCLIFGSFNI